MNARDILGKTFECECGKTHTVPVRDVVYAEDAVQRVPELLERYAPGRALTLLADTRTYEVQGRAVQRELEAAHWQVRICLVPDPPHGAPVCDDLTRDALLPDLALPRDALIAVGSGVISDLCKWIAYDTGTPYLTVATAASMNGYASENIAPAVKGVKRVLHSTVPVAVAATPSVIREAPYELTTAGLGDVLAKPVSITDWRVNHVLFDEYYCPFCAQLIRELEPAYLDHPDRIREKIPEAIEALFSALIYSGLSMTLAGTSFPASGGEHLISHTLDMTAGLSHIDHDYHGRQVGLGTLFAAALYERLLLLERPEVRVRTEDTDKAYWQSLTPVVEEEHAGKRVAAARAAERLRKPGVWDAVRAAVEATAIPAAKVKTCLKAAGAAHCIDHVGCTRERFVEAILHSHQIRERYTVIDLARATGLLPELTDDIVDEYLIH